MPTVCDHNREVARKADAVLAAFEKTRAKLGNVNPITSWLRREVEAAKDDRALDALAAKIASDGTLGRSLPMQG